MPSERTKIGLEITPMNINAAVVDNGRVTHAFALNLPEHLVSDDHVASYEALGDILREELGKQRIGKMDCALALLPHEVYTRRITMPAMTVDELALNLPFEFRDYIAEEAEKYIFDYAMLDTTTDMSGKPIEFDLLAAATLKKTINSYGVMLRKCGLRLKIAAPVIMTYANIIAACPNPARDFCFLDIGTRQTMVHMFPKGRYEVTRPIEIGIETFVSAVADHFSIGKAIAASYLTNNYEGAMTIPACMQLYESLSVELGRIISFYGFNFPDSSLESVHYSGFGSMIEPLMNILREQAPIPLVSSTELLTAYNEDIPQVTLERCIVPVGIAMQSEGGR